MLQQLIHDKINEIFAEYQKANNIISGDIDPFDALQLDLIERGLEQLVEKVCAKQPKVDIHNLPKEFDFKSNINTIVPIYHAVETECDYLVTADTDSKWFYTKGEMYSRLLKGDFVIVEKEVIHLDDFTPSWYIYTDCDGEAHSETFGQITEDLFFTKVSKKICFDDLEDITVQKIYYKGKEVVYVGWQLCMKYEYKDLDGNTVWVGYFPEWDH